jgi:hypothetical protein
MKQAYPSSLLLTTWERGPPFSTTHGSRPRRLIHSCIVVVISTLFVKGVLCLSVEQLKNYYACDLNSRCVCHVVSYRLPVCVYVEFVGLHEVQCPRICN